MSFRDLGSLLPITITVASAIVLFIIKEVLDFIKIRRSDGRKKVAIRTLIAKECEINYDITRAVEDILRHINVWISSSDINVKVENLVDGRKNLIISIKNRYFSYIVSKSHKSILEKNLLDIAVLDKNLFEKSAITYENLGYLDSIISDMCDIPTYGKENVRVFMIEIHDQLVDVQNAISDLYRECTGKDLKEIFATPKL